MPATEQDDIPGAVAVDDTGKPIPRIAKRGRGRPPGAKNKRTLAREAAAAEDARILAEAKAALRSATAGSTAQHAPGAESEEDATELPTLLPAKPAKATSAASSPPSLPPLPLAPAPGPVHASPKPATVKPAATPTQPNIAQPEPSHATQTAPVVSLASPSILTRRG